ncbi:hypothetical protein N9917_04390 [Deltaproteobacteria bacterium]|nr:hypothetical protein [Deltaproteobacteria bacterium]
MSVRADQLDTVASEFESAGTDSRQLSIKPGGVTEGKLGFSWETVDVLASAFSYSAPRSTYTLTTAASADANVLDNAELLRNGITAGDRVTTTAAAGEWSISGTTLSIHGDITATGDSYTLRYVVGSGSGASAASGNTIWLGTVPQEPSHAKSDYFEGAALDSKWTEWDENSSTTITVDEGTVAVLQTTSALATWTGLFQTAPTEDNFCVTIRAFLSARFVTHAQGGVFVAGDLVASPASANFATSEVAYHTTEGSRWASEGYDDYNGPTNFGEAGALFEGWGYLRVYVDRTGGGTFQALYSPDGQHWIRFAARTWAAAGLTTVDTIGIGANNIDTGGDITLRVSMFRVDLTTDPELPVGGYVGTSVPSTFLTPRDVTVAGNSTLDLYGWTDRRAKLVKCEAFCTTVATVGAYTLAVHKDPNVTNLNMLSAATFDLTTSGTLSPYVPTDVPLSGTADNLILDVGDVWEVSFVSDNAGLDAAGVYFQLTWLVL